MTDRPISLDFNASTPIAPEAIEATTWKELEIVLAMLRRAVGGEP